MTNMTEPTQPGLGTGLRIVWDERSRAYPIRSLLDPTVARSNKRWSCPLHLDQLQEGACCGFAAIHEALADPVSVQGKDLAGWEAFARQVYKEAQKIDEWPGEDYEGTSILAAAKIMQKYGYWPEYRWCFGVDDLIDTLVQYGPVDFGTPWYSSMFAPNAEGRMVISGTASGGHSYIGDEIDWSGGKIWMFNSWMRTPDGKGSFWGIDGRAWMPIEDWDKLLKQGGQVIVPVKRTDPFVPTPPEPIPPVPNEPTLRGATEAEFNAEFNRRKGFFKGIDISIDFTNPDTDAWKGHFEA